MKHQNKTFVAMWLAIWMFGAFIGGGGLVAHIIAFIVGVSTASIVDIIGTLYERKVIRNNNSK